MSVENEKEIQQLKNRIRELAEKSYQQNQYTFTGFLGLAEQDALWQVEREVKFAGITLYGGREDSCRKHHELQTRKEGASGSARAACQQPQHIEYDRPVGNDKEASSGMQLQRDITAKRRGHGLQRLSV